MVATAIYGRIQVVQTREGERKKNQNHVYDDDAVARSTEHEGMMRNGRR